MAAAGHRTAALLAAVVLLLTSLTASVRVREPLPVRPVCVKVHGVVAGETCASVARDCGLRDRRFMDLNPNVTCAALFPGQWLCVDGALIG